MRYCIDLDPTAASFYGKVADVADLPIERVLADSLYKLAGSLSMEAIVRAVRTAEKP